jgi:hypothetical protein
VRRTAAKMVKPIADLTTSARDWWEFVTRCKWHECRKTMFKRVSGKTCLGNQVQVQIKEVWTCYVRTSAWKKFK